MSETLIASRVVTSGGVLTPGWVSIEAGVIVGVGEGEPELAVRGDAGASRATRDRSREDGAETGAVRADGNEADAVREGDASASASASASAVRNLGDVTLVPGFVDAHVHGGGGSAYPEVTKASSAAARTARLVHLSHGTTTTMASLVAASPEALLEQVRALAPLVAGGTVVGLHLEGPWISSAHKGAHDERVLRAPDINEIDELLRAADGTIRMVTIAPELPGALAAISQFVAAGVVVAIGHTGADFEQTKLAIDAGATVATHLFNAMPELHHRNPGPVLALLEDDRVTLELVADGVHLGAELVRWVERIAGSDRVMLVTDAMGAAACGDGRYRLGVLDVEVQGGVAKLAGTETIAGSTATMDALFRQCVSRQSADRQRVPRGMFLGAIADGDASPTSDACSAVGTSQTGDASSSSNGETRAEVGANSDSPVARDTANPSAVTRDSRNEALVAAVRETSTNPARALGLTDVGDIAVGRRADFVVFDADLRVEEVILCGKPVETVASSQ